MSVQCSVAPLLFHLTFRTRGHKFTYIFYLTDTLLYTVYSKNAHRKLYWGMHMFMDSNKLQNYEKIRSSDQSHIWLPFITSILSPQPPPTHLPPPVTSLSWFKFRKRIFRHFKILLCNYNWTEASKEGEKKKAGDSLLPKILSSFSSKHHLFIQVLVWTFYWRLPAVAQMNHLYQWWRKSGLLIERQEEEKGDEKGAIGESLLHSEL